MCSPRGGDVVKKRIGKNRNGAQRGLSEADVDRLLSRASGGEEFGSLAATVEALRRAGEPGPTEAEVEAFAARAARLVPDEPARAAAPARGAYAGRRRRLRLGFAVSSLALLVLVSGFGGLAYAANGAVPGDALYGVDLALEKVGVGDGGLTERLTEAGRLVEEGRVQEGLNHAGDAIAAAAQDDEALQATAATLRTAAADVASNQNLQSAEGRALLAEGLRKMAAKASSPEEFGRAAQELAGSLAPDGQDGGGAGQGPSPDGTDSGGGGTGEGSTGTTQGSGPAGGNGGPGGSGQSPR